MFVPEEIYGAGGFPVSRDYLARRGEKNRIAIYASQGHYCLKSVRYNNVPPIFLPIPSSI